MKGTGRVRVLAIDPTQRGFGFILLEGPRIIVDWGVKSGRAASILREQQLLAKFSDLLSQYQPDMVIVENMNVPECRRRDRARLLVATMENLAIWRSVAVRKIPLSNVKKTFRTFGARSKHEIACAISRQLPEIAPRLPRKRKPWTGEHYAMAAFNAGALALTYFYMRPR